MFFDLGDLDDLVALPASREHRALFPVMDIQGLFIEESVHSKAEIALPHLLCSRTTLLLLFPVGVIGWLLLGSSSGRGLLASLSFPNISLDHLLWLGRWLPLWLLGWAPLALVNLSELGHQSIQRGLAEALVVF